ncbi:hypothetical protein Goari_024863, partial [Gossypium aridum]|nr:hypothetical protein [Gossypium aridum]
MFFYGKEEEARVIWDRAKTLCQDFRIHNLINKPVLPLTLALKKWEKPPCGTVKINFDATVFNNKTGFGVIVHDSDGFILGGGGGFKYEDMTAEWVKLYAFEEGLKIVCSLNITKAIFKIDCLLIGPIVVVIRLRLSFAKTLLLIIVIWFSVWITLR